MTEATIEKHYTSVFGKRMAFTEEGAGETILFLHGNPTSSYLWRNIIPHLSDIARCVAPDLIGMGDSEPVSNPGPGSYRFFEHREYLDILLDQLTLGNQVTLVVHDLGSALGFDWARRNQERIKGIAYMEAIVRPVTREDWPKGARSVFEAIRSPAGESLVIEQNIVVEKVLPASIIRDLTDEEMEAYRAPFASGGETRRPTLTWPRDLPIDGEPEDMVEIVAEYAAWLESSDIPKLFINADPGAILVGRQRDYCRAWPNQAEVEVQGTHLIQEDSPDEIGMAIRDWYLRLEREPNQ